MTIEKKMMMGLQKILLTRISMVGSNPLVLLFWKSNGMTQMERNYKKKDLAAVLLLLNLRFILITQKKIHRGLQFPLNKLYRITIQGLQCQLAKAMLV